MFDRQAMERMGGIREFGCDTKERAADYLGPVRISFEFDQNLTEILWRSGIREIIPESSIAVFEVYEHEGILAFEMPIKLQADAVIEQEAELLPVSQALICDRPGMALFQGRKGKPLAVINAEDGADCWPASLSLPPCGKHTHVSRPR